LIYLDTSVALAQLLAEDHRPAASLWRQPLIASRLLQYEVWVRLHARRLGSSHGEAARELLGRVAMVELVPPVLSRALEPFPVAVRTLDALHLATIEYLRTQRQDVTLASYDDRLVAAAAALGIAIADA
jgi:predicted nucleic acid-binding protein